jgi:ribonuclease P protein component
MTVDAKFPAEYHIRRGADFERTYRRRAAASDGVLLVFACENQLPHARIGLSVSRKVGGAVQRNRWKRRLREAFRLNREKLPRGVDLVVIPKAEREPLLPDLASSLVRLAQRATRRLAPHAPGGKPP